MPERDSFPVGSDTERLFDLDDARLYNAAGMLPASVREARGGFRPAGGGLDPGAVFASATNDTFVHVTSFVYFMPSARGQGLYTLLTDGQTDLDVLGPDPADSTLTRHDLIIAQQNDAYFGDPDSKMRIRRVKGTPNAAPQDPSLAAYGDYVPLARVRVPPNASVIRPVDIDDIRPNDRFTVALGGVLPVASQAERNAIIAPYDGMAVWRRDRDWLEVHDGTAWRVQGVAICTSTADRDSAITNPEAGQLAFVTSNATLYRYTGGGWVTVNPFVHAYQGGAVTIPNITATAIVMAQEVDDTLGWHSTVTNPSRVTPTLAGKYKCTGQIAMTGSVAGPFYGQFRKNGLEVPGGPYRTSHAVNQGFAANTAPAEATIDCNGSTDYIELFVHHAFGAAANTFSNASTNSWMRIQYLGP